MRLTTLHLDWSRRLHDWLSPADRPGGADLIFVLAGGMDRKSYGLELFRHGLASRILLSVGRFEIRRFSKMRLPVSLDLLKIAQDWAPAKRHFFVLFEDHSVLVKHVPPRRFGTLNEISALQQWVRGRSEIRSLLIVSDATHLRRLRMCCRTLLRPYVEVRFLAAPGATVQADVRRNASLSGDLLECLKILFYSCVLKLGGLVCRRATLSESGSRSASGSDSTDKNPH